MDFNSPDTEICLLFVYFLKIITNPVCYFPGLVLVVLDNLFS